MGSAVLRLRARLCWRIFPYRREAVLKTVRAQAFASGCALLSECSQNFRQIAVHFAKCILSGSKSPENRTLTELCSARSASEHRIVEVRNGPGAEYSRGIYTSRTSLDFVQKKFASLRMQYVKTAVFWHTFKLTGLPQPSVGLWAWPCTGRVYFGQFFEICLGKCDFCELGHISGSFYTER